MPLHVSVVHCHTTDTHGEGVKPAWLNCTRRHRHTGGKGATYSVGIVAVTGVVAGDAGASRGAHVAGATGGAFRHVAVGAGVATASVRGTLAHQSQAHTCT